MLPPIVATESIPPTDNWRNIASTLIEKEKGEEKSTHLFNRLISTIARSGTIGKPKRQSVKHRLMRAIAKKIGILLVGWTFILFGLVGLILPILHGTLFLLIGLAILSSEYVWAHRLLFKIRNRFPLVTARLEQATTAAHERISKAFHRGGPPAE